MSLGIALFLAAAMAVMVAAPLLTVEVAGEGVLPVDVTPSSDLKRRRMVIYENAQDLEFEFKAGKIAQNDYEALKQEYRMEAAKLMADSQAAETLTPEEGMIERGVGEPRARRKAAPVEDYTCEECGFENPLPVKFCGDCGAKIVARKQK
jgi:predicted RNA-binding Zn-ribbon protein involved in translation (DUF1610 family)